MSRFWLVFFLNFHGKAYVDTVRVNMIIISQQNLKVELFHISAGWMCYFLPNNYVFKHPLKFKLKKTRYVFSNVFVISSCTNQFSIFFNLFCCIVIIKGCSTNSWQSTNIIVGRNLSLISLCIKYSLSLSKYSCCYSFWYYWYFCLIFSMKFFNSIFSFSTAS